MAIPNGIVKEDWENPEPLPERQRKELEKLRTEGKFIVGYFGGHALSNALDMLLDAAKEVKEKDIQFVLVGNGVEKERLIKRTEDEKIKNVLFLPPVPKRAVPKLLQYFDCSFISLKPSPLYRFGICLNKMYDSMMAAKPVLLAVDVSGSPVEKFKCGIIVRACDANEIAANVEKIFRMPEERRREMGVRGRLAVREYFDYDVLAVQFVDIFS